MISYFQCQHHELMSSSARFLPWLYDLQACQHKSVCAICRGSQIFPTFVKLLKAEGEEAKELRDKLGSELDALGKHVESNGPFLKGQEISAGDLALGPKLYHAFTALKEFKVAPLSFGRIRLAMQRLAKQTHNSWIFAEDLQSTN